MRTLSWEPSSVSPVTAVFLHQRKYITLFARPPDGISVHARPLTVIISFIHQKLWRRTARHPRRSQRAKCNPSRAANEENPKLDWRPSIDAIPAQQLLASNSDNHSSCQNALLIVLDLFGTLQRQPFSRALLAADPARNSARRVCAVSYVYNRLGREAPSTTPPCTGRRCQRQCPSASPQGPPVRLRAIARDRDRGGLTITPGVARVYLCRHHPPSGGDQHPR